jgi:outer membrane protein assembly factor BamE (lipoprotein component of BamABCDE complex)
MKLPTWITVLVASLASALLPACDVVNLPKIQPGITTQLEVRSLMGNPGFVHQNADGTTTWEYSRQPAGVDCYMIGFDTQDIVSRFEQVLSPENYGKIQPGMTQNEVRRLLGQPGSKGTFANLQEEIWEWRIRGEMPTDETYFMVHFTQFDSAVKKTAQRVQPKG